MITLKVSWWELVTTGYLDPNGYKKGKDQATSQIEFRCKHEQTGQKSYTNSTLNITNEETVIITAMIDRLRRRWGLQGRQGRHRRYWVRPWLTQAEREEEGQYTRLIPRLELDDSMAY